MDTYPDGTYAEFCRKQASAEAQADQEPVDESPDRIIEAPKEEAAAKEGETSGGLKRQRTKTIKDKDGNDKTLTVDPEISLKLDQADEDDKKLQEAVDEELKKLKETSEFSKIMVYNHPKILIVPALLAVAMCGFTQPLFGWIFSLYMKILTTPDLTKYKPSVLALKGNALTTALAEGKEAWRTDLQDETVKLTLYTVYIAVAMFVGIVGKSFIFGYLGENVTMKIRVLLYKSILSKHIGFFD